MLPDERGFFDCNKVALGMFGCGQAFLMRKESAAHCGYFVVKSTQ